MPKSKALKASPLVQEAEEELLRDSPIPLTLDERVWLRAALNNAAFKKALKNARCSKPGAFVAGLNTALGSVIANNKLHQIQGWEMFEAALALQVEDPKAKAPKVEDDYLRER